MDFGTQIRARSTSFWRQTASLKRGVRLQRVSRMVSYPTPRMFLSFAIRPVIGFGRREINRQISFLPAVQPQKGVGSSVEPGWSS